MFVSRSKRMQEFIRMAEVISFLESPAKKEDKVLEIKMAMEDGIITQEEAVELACEFC